MVLTCARLPSASCQRLAPTSRAAPPLIGRLHVNPPGLKFLHVPAHQVQAALLAAAPALDVQQGERYCFIVWQRLPPEHWGGLALHNLGDRQQGDAPDLALFGLTAAGTQQQEQHTPHAAAGSRRDRKRCQQGGPCCRCCGCVADSLLGTTSQPATAPHADLGRLTGVLAADCLCGLWRHLHCCQPAEVCAAACNSGVLAKADPAVLLTLLESHSSSLSSCDSLNQCCLGFPKRPYLRR